MATRSPGRPRSEAARQAILRAAVRLTNKHGYGALTMEGIARAAGVGKQTLYRWWSNKAEIILEAINEAAAEIAPLGDDVPTFIRRSVLGAGGANTELLAGLMAEAQTDPAFGESFRNDFLAKRRAVLRELLIRARERGEMPADAQIDAVVELVFASIWYRILVQHAALGERFADQLTANALLLLQRPR
jgi:AcrR family transcriptional regulator